MTLVKLAGMKARSLITEAEYVTRKNKLLGGGNSMTDLESELAKLTDMVARCVITEAKSNAIRKKLVTGAGGGIW